MSVANIEELLISELKDLYSAEKQITKALPKMAKAATSPQLRAAFESHLKETNGHVQRLEQIFETLGKSARGKLCHGMQGECSKKDPKFSRTPRKVMFRDAVAYLCRATG